jgi:hypothetical protein
VPDRAVPTRALVRSGPSGRRQARPRALVVLVVLLALGASAAYALGGDDPEIGIAGGPELSSEEPATPDDEVEPDDELPLDTVVAWTRSRLPEGYAADVAADPTFSHATLVRSGTYRLIGTEDADGDVVDELPEGWFYPVEVLVLADSYDELAERPLVGDLEPDEVLLSASSAEVRRLGPGATLRFEKGSEVRVAAVVPDELIGAGEVVARAGGPFDPDRERYVAVRPTDELGDRAAVEDRLRELLPVERALGTVARGEEPVLRHSAGVLAPARMKSYFGEFAMRDAPGRSVQTGYSWIQEHIRVEEVPILGRVECHREMFEPLRAAMQELVDRGAAHTIDRGDYGGCWVARTQGGELGPLSSHAWGVSIDFNVSDNHLGMTPSQDPVLVEVMARHGFTWGGEWLLPDAMHFELVPDRDPARDLDDDPS